ncbi:MAG: hypothetical protein PF961_03685 [Planctomycetota bacterium]|jgi:uncharacterized membrane protein YqiK|nr:hypothetical protein [Planctomycetota bacterium]
MSILITIAVIAFTLFFLLFAAVAFFKAFYRKVDQGKALIVNTMRATPTVTFTGCPVYPVIHRAEVMDISVKTIDVDRRGKDGLICRDNIRADITVALFVRVNKTTEDVLNVASSVGVDRASDIRTLEALFQAKFSEALKTVGKQMDFIELYNERQRFKEAIIDVIGKDLNGYTLEDAAIDYLEQTPLDSLDPDNILDAQGRKKIIELTSDEQVKANQIQRDAQKTIKKQDVEAREAILALERQEEEAISIQQRDVEVVRARETAEIQKVQFEEHRRSEEAKIQAEQELGIQRENAQREIEVANQNRQRSVQVEMERVKKERDLEVINRERATELSRIEKEKALEIEKKAIADVVRERVAVDKSVAQEEERIKDLRATMEANRHKEVALTKASQEAEDAKLREVKAAEAAEQAAGFAAKERLVLAEAEQVAAEKEAIADIRRAEGVQAREAASGLAQAKVKEADALANEKQGLAKVRVDEAEVGVIAARGEAEASMIKDKGAAEASAVQAKMAAEAKGIGDKAEAMKLLNESTREHEEFRLKLEKELEIAKAEIQANITIAERNADILGRAMSGARFDIVGGDGAFFDRFVKAVSVGKSIDGALDRSTALQTAAKEYIDGDRSLPQDLKEVLSNSKLGTDDLKNLAATSLLSKLAKGKDPKQVQALLDKAKELGFGDEIAGWLSGGK